MKLLAVDVGGSHVSCAALDDDMMLESMRIETNSGGGLTNLLPTLTQALHVLRAAQGGDFAGIAFGFCGLVDANAMRVISTNHKYADATAVDLVAWAKKEFGLPLMLENDARLALLGEHCCGAAQGIQDVVMITLGTGIGTAALMEGHLVRGKHFQAGCLGGHFTIVVGGRLCSCGARGCFEAEASTYALPDVCRTWPDFDKSALARENKLDFETLFRCADKGDRVAIAIRERSVKVWSSCALSLVHAYDPELLVVGGGVMKNSYPLLEAMQEHVDSYAWTPWGKVRLVAATLADDAALFGAAPLFQSRG